MIEDGLDPAMHHPPGQQRAQFSTFEFVVEDVVHLDPTFHLFEVVLMVPQGVGSKPLLVDEVLPLSSQCVISVTHVMGMLNSGRTR